MRRVFFLEQENFKTRRAFFNLIPNQTFPLSGEGGFRQQAEDGRGQKEKKRGKVEERKQY